MSFRFRVDKFLHKDSIGLWMIKNRNGKMYLASPIELKWKERPESWVFPDPSIELRSDEAFEMIHALLDALAENEFIQIKTQKADQMKEHLEDIRKISDRLLKMIEEKL